MTKEDIALLNLPSLSLIPGYDDTQFSNVMPGIELQPVDIRPQTKSTLDSMRNNATMDLFSGKNRGGDTLDKIIAQSNSKINISGGFANVYDTHDQLSDGSFTPKYKNYIKGVDNNARLASTQSSMERFFNPVLRGATKVARGIPLDIASFVYGVGDAIGNGRFENLYDNDLAKWGDDLDKRADNSFSNYYTQDQSKLTNPTYLWDKTLGGAEFTARMIGSEALIAVATGGTSVAGSIGKMSLKGLAKAGRVAEALDTAGDIARVTDKAVDVVEVGNKGSKVLKTLLSPFSATAKKGGNFSQNVDQMMGVMNTVNKDYKYRELLKTGRFALTGSAYEAGFEARHFENEAQQAFWNYHRENGTTPTTEEIGQFYTKLDGQANNVFAINMGLLSVSNIALFGNMLNIKSPFGKIFGKIGDKTSAKLFGQGIEEVGEKGVATAIKANLGQKVLAYANPIAKGFFTEGVFEEGGQGIASNMMKNYVASAYDPQAMRDTATYTNAFSKAFNDQFSTKEGTEEIIIGGIIGGLFGGVGGIRETNRDYKKQDTKANIQTYINKNQELLYTDANLASLFASTSRNATLQQQLDKAVSENKITESSLKQAETFVSMLESAYSVGKEGDIVDVLTSSLQGADNKNISERLGIDENLVDSFKQSQIEGVNSILDTYKTSRQFAENIFNGSIRGEDSVTRANMISGLSYAMTMGKVSEMTANNLFDNVRTKVKEYFGENDIYNSLNTVEVLAKMSAQEIRELSDFDNNIKNLTEESKQKAMELSQLAISKDATPEQKTENVNRQNKLQKELQILNDYISDMRNKSDLLKSSVISNFYSVKKDIIVSKEDLTDFQDKIDVLNKAISKLSDKSNAHELITSMNEFNEANNFYKQFSDLANAFTSPELQYSTYNHIFSSKRTKNKKLNDFTKDFLDKASNVKRGVISTYNGSIETELENFDGRLKPSKALINHIENKEEELTEKEQQVLDYINNDKNSFERLLEKSKLLKRKKELEEKVSELDSNSLNNIEIQKNIDSEIQKVKDRLNSEISNIDIVLRELNSSDKQGVLNEIDFLEGTNNIERIEYNNDLSESQKINLEASKNGQKIEDYPKLFNSIVDLISTSNSMINKTFNVNGNKVKLLPFKGNILNGAGQRIFVKVEINGVNVTFYSSTGSGGKSLQAGRFYPTLGIESDERFNGTWINKINGVSMASYYNSTELANVAQFLDDTFGNINDYANDINTITMDSLNPNGEPLTKDSALEMRREFNHEYLNDSLKTYSNNQVKEVTNSFENLVDRISKATKINSTNELDNNIDFEIAKTKTLLDLHLKKDRLTQEANNEIEFLEGSKEIFPIDELIDGLTKKEYAELQSIITELQNNPTTIEDLEAQNNIYKQEISSIYNDGEVDKTLKDLDKYYISDINSEVSLTKEQENRVNELLNLIRDNKLLAQSMKAPKFNNSDSLENQITSFIESNPIFSNESSPYYGSESITQNEMNEFEVLKENNEKTEEEQERYEELLTKVERLVIEDHLEFGGGTLADLMDLKSQAEQLTENSNETSIEVNERIFHEAMQPIVNNDINGFVSEYVSLVWDNSVASNGVIDGEDVTRLHNLRLENLLNRFFASNPTATVQFRELGSGEVISEVGIDEFSSEATLYDNKSGIEIVFPNGERLMKPESSRSITGSSFGYTGNINDFGLTRIASPNNNSGFDPLYEKNSQDGYSQVKSDFEVTINGVPLDFKPEVINSLTVDSKVDLVYLPEADYSIAVGQSLDDSVIVIRYKGENVGILKASKGEWGTLREKRKAVIFNGTIKGVKINETYFGLPNIEYDSNNNIVTHDASHITNLGYRKPDGSYVHTEGAKKTNVDYSLIDAVKNDGTITPFALITFGKKKYAIPIIVENEISDMSNLIEDIINKDINDSKKVYELNEMLNKNGLYNSENKFDLEKINETEHVNKIKDILSNSEKLTNILDHEAFKKSKKRIILDLNNPFGASKFKLDLKGISNKPENDVESGKVSTKLEKEGEKEAKKVTCKKKK